MSAPWKGRLLKMSGSEYAPVLDEEQEGTSKAYAGSSERPENQENTLRFLWNMPVFSISMLLVALGLLIIVLPNYRSKSSADTLLLTPVPECTTFL